MTNKKLIIVKAKIGKHIYKIEMEVKSSFSEIIKEVAIQHEVEPQLIYNEICRQLTYKIANNYGVSGQVEVIIDKSLYGAQRTAFNAHMADRSGVIVPVTLGEVKVTHVDSKACPCIQAVDFIAGAINRKYRDDDDLYYQKIQHKISLSLEYEPD